MSQAIKGYFWCLEMQTDRGDWVLVTEPNVMSIAYRKSDMITAKRYYAKKNKNIKTRVVKYERVK